MGSYECILTQYVSEQIALEEHLSHLVAEQMSEIDNEDYAGVHELLASVQYILEQHFQPLNDALSVLENENAARQKKTERGQEKKRILRRVEQGAQESQRISKMLRDDYSALNSITMSNTLLHTTALLVDKIDVANLALQHLKNLTPLVVKIGELVPEVIAQELRHNSPKIDCSLAKTAIENVKSAWRSRKG